MAKINFFERKLKLWQFIVIMLFIALVVMFLLYKCGKPQPSNPPEKPIIKTEKEIITQVVKDSLGTKVMLDSMGGILGRIDNELGKALTELLNEQDKSLFLLQENDSLLSLVEAGELANTIRDNSELKDSLCNKTIAAIRQQVFIKNQIINQKDTLYKKLRSNLDTCLKNQSSLTKSIEKDKPRNKISFGFVGNVYPEAGIGGGGTFIGKKGLVVDLDVMRMNSNWYVGFGIKKVLSFRKK